MFNHKRNFKKSFFQSSVIDVTPKKEIVLDTLPFTQKLSFEYAKQNVEKKQAIPGSTLLKKLYKEQKKDKDNNKDKIKDNISKYTNSINDIIKDIT
jgi:hypothetical protein